MRFLLLEKAPQPSEEQINSWEIADQREKEKIVRQLVQQFPGKSRIMGSVIDSFRKSCYTFGIDPSYNGFMQFYDTLSHAVPLNNNVDNCLSTLIDLVAKRDIAMPRMKGSGKESDYIRQWFFEESLYHRNPKDFAYTVKAFETVSNPSLVSKYFKNPKGISIDQFFDQSGNIKPAGSPATADDTNTIYGVIESWSNGGENENPREGDKGQKITKKSLNNAPKFRNLKEVPQDQFKEGNIIYVNFIDHKSDKVNFEDQVDAYFIYSNGQWNKLDV